MRTALVIAGKDLRQRLRDRSFFLFALALPLGLAVIFSLVLGDLDGESEVFRYGVVDEDGGELAGTFTDQFLPAVASSGVIDVEPVESVPAGRQRVDDGELAAVFVVPAGFSDAVQSGQPVTIEVIGDVDATFGVQVAQALADSYLADVASVRLAVAAAAASGSTTDPAVLAERAVAVPNPLPLVEDPARSRALDSTTYFSAGMAVFFLFFTVQFGVSSLLEERATGTMARLLAAPIRPVGILVGKLLTSFAVGVLAMGLLVAATSLLLGASWGDPVGVAVLVVSGVLAATGVMALVASLANTTEQAGSWQSIIAVVMGALGGAFFPVGQAGGLMSTLSYVTPHRWFLQGLADLSGGGGLGAVWLPALVMFGFAAVTGGIAILRGPKLVRV
ncbi:MAG TPA: ABC transporter permease [Natronosporangium sp.]